MSDNMQGAQRDRINIPLRPFTRGMILNVSPTMLPAGAVVDANGFIGSTSGLSRRGGMDVLDTFDPPPVSRYDYINSFINDDGTKTTYAIADGKFYELAGTTFLERPCEYTSADDTPTASTVSGTAGTTAVVGTDTTFNIREIATGDLITIDPSGANTTYTVDVVASDGLSVTVLESIEADFTAVDFTVQRLLYPAPEWQITVARIDRILYICTGTRPLLGYNIDFPDKVIPIDTERPFIPKTIMVFNDRLWCGNIFIPSDFPSNTVPNRWYTNRVCWSTILPESGYAPTTIGAVDINPLRNFNDLIEIGGEISGLSPLGSYMAVFFEYGIQYGRETQVPGDTLPLAFDIIPSGRRGVLQPGAITSTKNGLFYVSTDNVYYLGINLQVLPMADAVDPELFRPQILNTRYKIENFNEVAGLIIGCGYNEDSYDEFWVFNLHTKAWTRFEYACSYFNTFTIGSRLTFSDYSDSQIFGVEPPGVNDDALGNILPESPILGTQVPIQPPVDLPQYALTAYTDSKAIFSGESSEQTNDRFYATVGADITVMGADLETDQDNAPVSCLIETGDFDFGRPDQNKTVYKMAMRIFNIALVNISYHIEGSLDSGVTWWDLGNMILYSGGKEGKCNFQFTGSAPRFRLTSNSVCPAYEIIEVTLDVKGRGKQFSDT